MVRMNKRPFPIAVGILGILTAMLVLVSGCGKGVNSTEYSSVKSEIGTESTKKQESDAVMYLDGFAVSEEEYGMLAGEYSNQIYMQYTTEQVNSEDFWETEIDGTAPCILLEEIILEKLKENYALKALAVELGVTEDYSYADLIGKMEAENGSEESGTDISYGLSSYDEASYYKYWYSNLETRVTTALIENGIDVPEKDCKDFYEENIDNFSYETAVSVWYAEIPYGGDMQQKEAEAKAGMLKSEMESAEETDDIPDEFDDVEIQELDLNSLDTQEGMSGIYSQRWTIASQLEEGETYGPYEQDGSYCVLKCVSRTENGILDFEAVSSRIERYLQQQTALAMIEEKAEEMEVDEGNLSAREVILNVLK